MVANWGMRLGHQGSLISNPLRLPHTIPRVRYETAPRCSSDDRDNRSYDVRPPVAANGKGAKLALTKTLEMVVASDIFGIGKRAQRRVVPDPKESALVQLQSITNSNKAVRAELSVASAELHGKVLEITQNKMALRQKDKEIAHLKAALAERDVKLKASKADLLEARITLQEKDDELQKAYEALTTASKERSGVRRQLIETQIELRETRAELASMADSLVQLKTVIDSADEDTEDLEQPKSAALTLNTLNGANGAVKPQEAGSVEESPPYFLDGAVEFLRGLVDLSRTIVTDAKEDEQHFKHSGTSRSKNRRKAN